MSIKTFSLPLVLSASYGLAFFFSAIPPVNAAPAVSFDFCVIEECTTAYQRDAKDHGLEITPPSSSECRTQKECMALAQKLYQLSANKESCSVKQFKEFESKVEAIDAKYTEIGQKYNIDMAAPGSFGESTKIMAGLGGMLMERFSKCEADKLFPEDTNECLSPSCKVIVAEIQNREVSPTGCKKDFDRISNFKGFEFEKAILQNATKKHVQACQDANITKIRFGTPETLLSFPADIYKKELPYMEAGNKLENEVKATLNNFKVNAENCTMDDWQSIYAKLKDMRAQYAQVQSIGNAGQNTFDRLATQLDKNVVECEKGGLFPKNVEECITDVCKKVVDQIKAIPISEEGCESRNIGFNYGDRPFKFEESLVKKANEEHVEACKDANITPVRNIGMGQYLYKKDMPFFEAGEKAEDALESALHGLDGKQPNQKTCSREFFETTGKNLQVMKENYGKLSAAKNYGNLNYENLEFARDRQAVRCSHDNLFPFKVEYGTCFTAHCKDALEGIENFKVGQRSCDFEIHGLSPNVVIMLKPETEYIQDRQNELFNQCVDAGFLDKMFRRKVSKRLASIEAPVPTSTEPRNESSVMPPAPIVKPQSESPVPAKAPIVKPQTKTPVHAKAPIVKPLPEKPIQTQIPPPPVPMAAQSSSVPTESVATNETVQRVVLKEDPNLTPEQAALLKRFYLMDVKEKTGGPDGTTQIIPYTQIGEKLKNLKATPEDCNAEKVFIPIYSSVVYFEDLFEAQQLPFPKELVDLRNEVWKYRDMCVKAGY